MKKFLKHVSLVITLTTAVVNLCSCSIFLSPKQVVDSSRESIAPVSETTIDQNKTVEQSLEDKITSVETTPQETVHEVTESETSIEVASEVAVSETSVSDFILKAKARPNDNVETDYDKEVIIEYARKNIYEPKLAEGNLTGNYFIVIISDSNDAVYDEILFRDGHIEEKGPYRLYASPKMSNETNIAKNFHFTTRDISMTENYMIQHKYTRDSDFKSVTIDLEYLATKPDPLVVILPEMFK